MSQVQGRVFDSSIYGWIADVAVSLAGAGYATYPYVDSSLTARDASIVYNLNYVNQLDASVIRIDTYNTIQDGSITNNLNEINQLDASVIRIDAYQLIQDNSMIAAVDAVDSSLVAYTDSEISSKVDAVDSSLVAYTNSAVDNVDSSLVAYTNSAVDNVDSSLVTYVDSEISSKVDAVDSSLVAYTDSEISSKVDAVDSSLVTYVDAYNNIQDTSINLKSDLTYVDASLNVKLKNTDDTFTGKLTLDGSLIINGDIIQDGSSYETHAEQIYSKDDFIILRDGAITGLVDPSISGIKVLLADGANNVILGTGDDAIMRVGWESDVLVALAAREDTPSDGEYAYWDDSSTLFKTYNLIGYIDGSLDLRDLEIAQLDASIIRIDASLGLADVTKVYVDGSLGTRDLEITQLDASVIRIDAYKLIQDNSIYKNLNEIAQLDASIIRIDASLGLGSGISQAYVDGSIAAAVDAVDSSLVTYIPTYTYNQAYIDASLNAKAAGITYAYVDGSLATRDIEIAQLDASIIRIDASLGSGTGGGSTTLAALTDTSIGSEVNDQVLAYDTDGSTYMNKTLVDTSLYSVVDASDYFWLLNDTSIDYSTITNDQTLAYQVDSSKWENKTLVDTVLYSIEDASIFFARRLQTSTPADGAADGSLGDWSVDFNYLYVCTDDASWGRISLERF